MHHNKKKKFFTELFLVMIYQVYLILASFYFLTYEVNEILEKLDSLIYILILHLPSLAFSGRIFNSSCLNENGKIM